MDFFELQRSDIGPAEIRIKVRDIKDVAPDGAGSVRWVCESTNKPLLTELMVAGAQCSHVPRILSKRPWVVWI